MNGTPHATRHHATARITRAAVRAVLLLAAVVLATRVAAEPYPGPKVPSGVHPDNAVAVAMIGPGFDYTRTTIADALARDGEGVLVGWDFIGRDARPHAEDAPSTARAAHLAASGAVALVPLRIEAQSPLMLPEAFGLAHQMPVRILICETLAGDPAAWRWLPIAARELGDRIVVVPAGIAADDVATAPIARTISSLATVIVVASANTPAGKPPAEASPATAKLVAIAVRHAPIAPAAMRRAPARAPRQSKPHDGDPTPTEAQAPETRALLQRDRDAAAQLAVELARAWRDAPLLTAAEIVESVRSRARSANPNAIPVLDLLPPDAMISPPAQRAKNPK